MNKRQKPGVQQQLRQLQLVTSESADGVIMIDINQQILWANAAALEVHDITSTAGLGQTIDDYHANFQVKFCGAQDAQGKQSLDSVVCGESYREVVVEVTPLHCEMPKWLCRVRNIVMVDDGGSPTCIMQILRPLKPNAAAQHDIGVFPGVSSDTATGVLTDNVASSARQEMLARLAAPDPVPTTLDGIASLCELAPVALCVMDNHMQILGVSQPWLEWLGYGREELIGRKIVMFMDPASADYFEENTWRALAHDAALPTTTSTFVTRTGRLVEALLSANVTLDAEGAAEFVVAAPTDISERKRSEEAFRAAFTLAPVPMLIRTLDEPRVLDANNAFISVTGHQPADIIGHGVDEFGLFENRSQKAQFEASLRSADTIQNISVKLKTIQGDMLDCLLSARRIDACGRTAVLLVLQDVSDRRRSEAQLFDAIQMVMADTNWFSRSVIEKLAALRSPPRPGLSHAEVGDLTPREREVLGLISHGMTDVDISIKLGLTRATVRNHVATLYSKINVHSRSSAIVWARERGINVAWPAMAARHGRNQVPCYTALPAPQAAKSAQAKNVFPPSNLG